VTATVHRLDGTDAAPLVTSGRYCLARMHIGDDARKTAIGAGLAVDSTALGRKAALLALADAYTDLERPDCDETWEDRQARYDDADNLAAVLRGLTPGMAEADRDVGWEYLVLAVAALADLDRHQAAGTTPKYLHRKGGDAELAMAAERVGWESEARVAAARLALGRGCPR
jgi:hypothetical protein